MEIQDAGEVHGHGDFRVARVCKETSDGHNDKREAPEFVFFVAVLDDKKNHDGCNEVRDRTPEGVRLANDTTGPHYLAAAMRETFKLS